MSLEAVGGGVTSDRVARCPKPLHCISLVCANSWDPGPPNLASWGGGHLVDLETSGGSVTTLRVQKNLWQEISSHAHSRADR